MNLPKLQFDPAFIEECVFLFVKSLEKGGDPERVPAFHSERSQIYEGFSGEEREQKFGAFFRTYFMSLGLEKTFETILMEFPLLGDPSFLVFVNKAWDREKEGSTLYVDGGLKTVLLALQAVRVTDLASLETFLRQELFHVCEMADKLNMGLTLSK